MKSASGDRTSTTRSLVLPIAGPVDATWPELRVALREAWGETTRAANWMLTELYARDSRRGPQDKKLGKMPKVYLYPEARKLFPLLASQTLSSLDREVTRKYRARRYEVLWTRAASLPTMRYPVGIPLHSQMWRLERDAGGAYLFSARLGSSEDGRRYTLRLRGGAHFRRMTEVLDRVIAGELKAGAATLYQITSHESDHRSEVTRRSRLVVRLPVEMPIRQHNAERKGVLVVATESDCLISTRLDERFWREHHDHVRRGIKAHLRQLQHLSDDLKEERRRPKRNREGIVERMGTLAHRHAQRMRSWLHEAAAHLVGYAVRNRVAEIYYDDADRTFCGLFPWHELRQRIAEKCEMEGIKLVLAHKDSPSSVSGELPGENAEALAGEIT